MTRTDARLLLAIVSTAAITATSSVWLWTRVSPAPPPAPVTVVDLRPLEYRIAALEDANSDLKERLAQLVNKPVDDSQCDEVSCVLDNYERRCCARFDHGAPRSLDRAAIAAGIAGVHEAIAACGDRISAKGKVRIHAEVAPNGNVSEVTVETTPDAALGACVAHIVQRAVFERTRDGGRFAYPFIF